MEHIQSLSRSFNIFFYILTYWSLAKLKFFQRAAGKDLKKKILAERRKQLNVDHLSGEKLQEKAVELHKWMAQLEDQKYDQF